MSQYEGEYRTRYKFERFSKDTKFPESALLSHTHRGLGGGFGGSSKAVLEMFNVRLDAWAHLLLRWPHIDCDPTF